MLAFSPAAFAIDPNQLPTDGRVVSGAGSIGTAGNQMTVTQNTQNMIVNWNTFNIGSQAGVNFVQPNAQATAPFEVRRTLLSCTQVLLPTFHTRTQNP